MRPVPREAPGIDGCYLPGTVFKATLSDAASQLESTYFLGPGATAPSAYVLDIRVGRCIAMFAEVPTTRVHMFAVFGCGSGIIDCQTAGSLPWQTIFTTPLGTWFLLLAKLTCGRNTARANEKIFSPLQQISKVGVK